MKNKKLTLLVLFFLVISLTGCNSKANETKNYSNSDSNSLEKEKKELIESYQSGTTEVSFYKDGTIVVSDKSGNGTGKMEDYDSLPPWNAFSMGVSMKKLIIEKGVLNLGDNSFSLFDLEQIEWSDDLERIGSSNFSRKYNLKLPKLPKNLKEIGTGVFAQDFECSENNILVIPKDCTKIGSGAFYNAHIHHFIIESENLTIISDDEHSNPAFWIGCREHTTTIEVKNENVKKAIMDDLKNNTNNGRINVIVKEN